MTMLIVRESAEYYRRLATEEHDKGEASFERCDTDGFATQAANDLMSRLYRLAAEIAEDGGYNFPYLMTSDRMRKVDAVLISGKYGLCWKLSDKEADYFGRQFVTAFPKRATTLGKHGLIESTEFVPAHCCAVRHRAPAGARGFSGMGNVSCVVEDARSLLGVEVFKTPKEAIV